MNLTDVMRVPVDRKRKFPVGRGKGSGKGKTCGRGGKGQYARQGVSKYPHFEGGQTPLVRKIPKRGFNNRRFSDVVATVNLSDLNRFNAGETIDPARLAAAGLVGGSDYVKILGEGQLEKPLKIRAHAFSASVAEKAKKAGATLEILPSERGKRAEERAKYVERLLARLAKKEQERQTRKDQRAKERAEKAAKRAAGVKEAAPKKAAGKEKDKAAKPKKGPEGAQGGKPGEQGHEKPHGKAPDKAHDKGHEKGSKPETPKA